LDLETCSLESLENDNMKLVPLHEFEIELNVSLDPDDLCLARKELNLHFFNDVVCNHVVNGQMVSKYPEIEKSNPQIHDAFYNVVRSYPVTVIMQLMSDGTLKQSY
jgi:hypothetical protein